MTYLKACSMACLLLLSGLALAGTHETSRRNVATPNNNVEANTERSPRTRNRANEASAKTAESVLRARSASAIRSIKVTKDYKRGGMLLATIELDGQPQYTHFTLPSPYRLVIDVQHVSTEVPSLIQVGMADVKRVRLGKMDDTVRVVFDAAKPLPYEINDEGSTIRIWFGEQKVDPTPTANNPQLGSAPNSAAKPLSATNVSRPAVNPTPPPPVSSATNTRAVTPVQPKPLAAETGKNTAPITINQPGLKSIPVQLPASPKALTKTIKSHTASSSLVTRLAPPANNSLAKASDAPPPPRTVNSSSASPAVSKPVPNIADPTHPVVPAKTETATTEAARTSAPNTAGSNVNATSTPVAAPPTTPLPAPIPKVAPTTVARTEPEKSLGSPLAPGIPPVTTAAAPTRPREVTQTFSGSQGKAFNANDYNKPDFVGEPINLDLRSTQGKTVDIRDFLRFISDTYKVNFVIDQSVKDIPITVTLQNVPWNQAMDALLRANRLDVKVEGSILRVMSQETMAVEDRIRQEQIRARQEATPLVTEMVRLNYARALTGAAAGGGSSGGGISGGTGGAGASGMASGAGTTAGGSGLDGIIRTRLSQRGSIQADPRTNTLIITDLPENIAAIKEIIAKLDVPEPQVEIESRIVIANRNFARDLGVQLGVTAINASRGSTTTFSTLPTASGGPTIPAGTGPNDGLRAAGAQSVLSLVTGLIGTTQISAILSAQESKGNVKTISSPRITAQNNQTANIVNGIQIPVQTESNNTLTVTFVTAALRLEITPQINDSGNVLLKVVAENNSVNTAIATRSAPGINTQRAETTVLVPDGGTTIIGGINIDVESNAQQRTPGISRVPGLGELFKRRTVSRQTDEILFFITPRIYRPLGVTGVTTSSPQK